MGLLNVGSPNENHEARKPRNSDGCRDIRRPCIESSISDPQRPNLKPFVPARTKAVKPKTDPKAVSSPKQFCTDTRRTCDSIANPCPESVGDFEVLARVEIQTSALGFRV